MLSKDGVSSFSGWLMMATEYFLCLCPSFVISEKSPAWSSDYCTCLMRCRRRSTPVYRVSSSHYDWIMIISCLAVDRSSCEWHLKAHPFTSGESGNYGGGKMAFDLNDAAMMDTGKANVDHCFAAHWTSNVIFLCFVAKSSMEWYPVSVTHFVYPWWWRPCWYMAKIWVSVVIRSKRFSIYR